MPFIVRTDGIGEDLQRKGGNRLSQRCRPELIAERREKKGRRLAGDSGHGDEGTGRNASQSSAQYDGDRGSPPRISQRERGLAQRSWHDEQQPLGAAADQ